MDAISGLISVVKNQKTVYKVITSCNGNEGRDLAKALRIADRLDLKHILKLARDAGFGCVRCLYVMSEDKTIDFHGSEVSGSFGQTYRQKFNDPRYNPLWSNELPGYFFIIERDDL